MTLHHLAPAPPRSPPTQLWLLCLFICKRHLQAASIHTSEVSPILFSLPAGSQGWAGAGRAHKHTHKLLSSLRNRAVLSVWSRRSVERFGEFECLWKHTHTHTATPRFQLKDTDWGSSTVCRRPALWFGIDKRVFRGHTMLCTAVLLLCRHYWQLLVDQLLACLLVLVIFTVQHSTCFPKTHWLNGMGIQRRFHSSGMSFLLIHLITRLTHKMCSTTAATM